MKYRQFVIGSLVAATLATSAGLMARPAAAGFGPTHSSLTWFLLAFELGPWEEYLIQELTPDLDRLSGDAVAPVSWVHVDEALLLPDFASALLQNSELRPRLSLARRDVFLQQVDGGDTGMAGQRLERSLMMPGITASMSERSTLTVGAVLATQRFVSAGMNLGAQDTVTAEAGLSGFDESQREVAYGAGVRLAFFSEPVDGLMLEAAYQSRIGMNEFAMLRGVHGSQAELDIPSRMNVGLRLRTTARGSLNFGASQIFYSEVGAFPSRLLPARFNSLLGDSTSPQFDWEDLMVYSLGWSWRHESDLEFVLDYRTRTQPRPRAPALASALAPELAQNAWLLGLSKGLTERSRLHINAAYAPPEFAFGGNVLGVVSDRLDQSFEVQAVWRHQF